MRRKRSRFALLGILALALGVTVGTLGGAAEAKKKGGGGKLTLNLKGGPIPDATNGADVDGLAGGDSPNGEAQNGILSLCKKVGQKRSAKIKETTVELSFTHGDTRDVQVLATGPKGLIELISFEGNTAATGTQPPSTVVGPTTFKDDAALAIDDTRSTADGPAFAGAGSEAVAPYAGDFRPEAGTLESLGGKTGGTWCIVAIDADPPDDGAADVAETGSITEAKFKFKTKG